MQGIAKITDLVVGEKVYIMERGDYVGPFTVKATTGGRSKDHAILTGPSGPFEHYVPFNTYRVCPFAAR